MKTSRRPWLALLVSLLLVAAVAAFGAQFAPGAWYDGLAKPAWTPPPGLFGPVWTLLYAMMALAAWKVWIAGPPRAAALAAYGVQLLLNGAWSWLFFGLHRIDLALGCIIALVVALVVTIALFWRRDRLAGLLLLPYLAWVGFATALNAAIWRLNG